jgi:hypothetical protein
MTPEQITQLLKLLERIADRPFTITQATDWQMLYVLLGMIASSLVIAVGLFWRDVLNKFKDIKESLKELKVDDIKAHDTLKNEYTADINNLKTDHVKDIERLRTEYTRFIDAIWTAMKDCQSDCCPPRRRKED